MRIFIATSSYFHKGNKTKKRLQNLIDQLRSSNFTVDAWWENGVLRESVHFLDSLISVAKSYDGAIFILRADDMLMTPDQLSSTPILPSNSSKKATPSMLIDPLKKPNSKKNIGVTRGNVLFECGLFMASKGPTRTYLIRDGLFDKIMIPSDLVGYKLLDLKNSYAPTAAINFFNEAKQNRKYDRITYYFGKDHIDNLLEGKSKNWTTKSLYVGMESAKLWSEVEIDERYQKDHQYYLIPEFISDPICTHNLSRIDNIISIGAGCGASDSSVVNTISNFTKRISYIPIDMNPFLAYKAADFITQKNSNLTVPFAIIEDFEGDYGRIEEILKEKCHSSNEKNLFIMLGGTFANLDDNEFGISNKLISWMSVGDHLLLDVYLKNDDYEFDKDRKRHVKNLPRSVKNLLRNSIVKKFINFYSHNIDGPREQAISDLVSNLNLRIEDYIWAEEHCLPSSHDNRVHTAISKTSVATYKFKFNPEADDSQTIMIVKRYDYHNFLEFLKQRFKIVHSRNGLTADGKINSHTGRGLFLLQKLNS